MKNLQIALTIISAATISASVHAQVQNNDSVYSEIGYLMANHKTDYLDPNLNGIRLTLGKEFGPNLAAEIMYAPRTNNGTGEATVAEKTVNYDVKLKNIYGIYLKPRVMVTQDLELFGKVGYTKMSRNYSVTNASNSADTATGSDSGSGVSYGFGLKYNLTPSISLAADHMSYYDKSSIKISGYTVGVGYRF